MINTYNESNLHATLKKLYALESNGTMETQLDDTPWICDIVCEDGSVIEIQTANLSALTEKVQYILETHRRVKIVHPIAETKWIERYAANGELLSRKKSPKKASIFDSLRGMTQICPLFLNGNCTLEVLYCEISEMRRETEEPTQNQTNTRRHLKNWVPMGKRLDKILKKERFCTKSDWITLLPDETKTPDNDGIFPEFRKTDFQKAIKNKYGAKKAKWAQLLLWIFLKMGIFEIKETKGKSKFYAIKK